jgi:SAM-dependent methyltransferase
MQPTEGNPRPVHTPQDFDDSYDGTPPWDIGQPQPLFVALAKVGELHGRVLDAGCGTGEHAIMAAKLGLDTTGIDISPKAIRIAEQKAGEQAAAVHFRVWSALRLSELGETFDTVLDSGLFHCFDDQDRAAYVASLKAVTAPGSRCFLACFSDRQPGVWGPRRVSQAEIRESFAGGWRVDSIEPAQFQILHDPPVAEAWLVRLTRV